MGVDAKEFEHHGPAAQEDEAKEPCCNVEGWHNPGRQVELMHYDAEDSTDDRSCEKRPELHMTAHAISPLSCRTKYFKSPSAGLKDGTISVVRLSL